MQTREDVEGQIEYFRAGGALMSEEAEAAILAAYQQDRDHQSLAIKILSIFGGALGSLAFIGFLLLTGIYDSAGAMLFLGLICIAGSVAVSRMSEKIILDTASVSFYLIGFGLLGVGLTQMEMSYNSVCFAVLALSIACLFLIQGNVLTFVSVLIANGSIMTLIISNHGYDLIHLYAIALSLFCTWFFLKEAGIVSAGNLWMRLYEPVRTGLIFSFLGVVACFSKAGLFYFSPGYFWISSLGIIASIVIVLFRIFEILQISEARHRVSILALSLLVLLPTAASPAISGSLLVILLSFLVNHKTGFVAGVIAFLYFLGQYYYDLHFTLLVKSVLLFSSGSMLLMIYLFTYKKLMSHEEN